MSTNASSADRTSTTSQAAVEARPPLPRHTKVGLALAGLLAVVDLLGLAFQTPEGQVGPPLGILLMGAALGVITLICIVIAWRTRSRGAIRIAAGARILSALGAVPAFFAGPPAPLVVMAAISVILTVACVILMLAGAPKPALVKD